MRTSISFVFVLALAAALVWVALQATQTHRFRDERRAEIAALENALAAVAEREAERERIDSLIAEIGRLEAQASKRGLDLAAGMQRYAVSYTETLALPQLASQLEQTRSSNERVFVPRSVRLSRRQGLIGGTHELELDGWAIVTAPQKAGSPAP